MKRVIYIGEDFETYKRVKEILEDSFIEKIHFSIISPRFAKVLPVAEPVVILTEIERTDKCIDRIYEAICELIYGTDLTD